MFDELAPHLTSSQRKGLLKRLENWEDPDQAIPAEYELALTWAASMVDTIEVERQFGRGRPDIYFHDLFGEPAAVDIATISDDALGGISLMRRAANIINGLAVRYSKDAPNHLHFEFLEESFYLPADRRRSPFTRYVRRRRVTRKFDATPALDNQLREWIGQSPATAPLRYEDEQIGVVISWKDYVHPQTNIFSSMPAVCYDVRDNPLYATLKSKARNQLRDVPTGTKRGIFICDGGCSLLRDMRPISGRREVSGDQILREFVAKGHVDFVAAFVPRRESEHGVLGRQNARKWFLYGYAGALQESDFDKIARLAALLPAPYLHGYQARSWHEQRMFEPQGRGHYLPAIYTGWKDTSEMKISARGLQEFLAGRIDREMLKRSVVGEHNFFEAQLQRGKTISNVRFEGSGVVRDDDYIVFEFDDDPAASPIHDKSQKEM
jgi:hypothetical protein